MSKDKIRVTCKVEINGKEFGKQFIVAMDEFGECDEARYERCFRALSISIRRAIEGNGHKFDTSTDEHMEWIKEIYDELESD